MADKSPKVSIIMPAYNAMEYIEEAVCSVLKQSWQNWELIIVNDGSTDGTGAYLETLTDDRIVKITQKNKGVSVARNRALETIKGSYVTFLDADDVFPENSIECRVNFMCLNPDCDVLGGTTVRRTEDMSQVIGYSRPNFSGRLKDDLVLFEQSSFSGMNSLLRSECLKSIKFKEGMSHAEDWLLYYELAYRVDAIYGFVGHEVLWYRCGHDSASTNLAELENGLIEFLEAIVDLPEMTRTHVRVCAWRVSILLLKIRVKHLRWKGLLKSVFLILSICL